MNLTTRTREWVRTWMPLEDMLPDQLPAFVRSPAYLFGVVGLSGLALLIVSGLVLAFFGPQWWHDSSIGRFVNSVHFWSAQAFFFAITLHLWTEFCKGAWRHGRRPTWVVGAITFVVAIGTAFTGYLSQTNFDAQWIAVQGKDAMNAIGIGSFFNLMNFGQMYGFHIVLFPLLVVLLVLGHVLQVRVRGVVRPYARSVKEEQAREEEWGGAIGPGWSPWTAWLGPRNRTERPVASDHVAYYRGLRSMPYDLLREGLIALLAATVFALVFAGLFSSPDDPPLTIQAYAQQDPVSFLKTSLAELAGTSTIAQYGPPYNGQSGSVQSLGPVSLQTLAGITIPLDTAQAYVLQPLTVSADTDPSLTTVLQQFASATDEQRVAWEKAYAGALDKTTVQNGTVVVPGATDGPLPAMMGRLLVLGRNGALDGLLVRSGGFYQANFTKPLLFLSEDALPARAENDHLLGTQWGMMNETGNYPGQAWLWLYTFWYQIPPYSTSPNADALVWGTIAVLTLALIVLPFIPYLNRLPYHLGVHRLIWREDDRHPSRSSERSGPTS
ncbi:MAG TPA: cytochrome b N-terminal domain-containing protein [Chloroflexota bacterium]|nr:cytochrome b N-terminal domain-containing protein [Chloroflexota bacterium]